MDAAETIRSARAGEALARPEAVSRPLAAHGHVVEGLGLAAWSRAQTLYACAALGLFAVIAASGWLLNETLVPWDSKNHFYPMFRFLADAFRRGEIPLWNPYHFGGHPTVADPQSLLFSPTMALSAWLFPDLSMRAFDLAIFAHLSAGGFAILALAHRRGWAAPAAVLTAMVYMLGGSASARLQHTGMILSYSWFAMAFLALELMLERQSWRRGAAFGAAFGVLAAAMAVGRDQVAFLFCLFLLAYVAWKTIRSGAPLLYLRSRAPALAAAALTGGALLAVPALLTLQLLSDSNRPGIAYGVAVAGSLHPVNFATLFAPDIFGSLDRNFDYWGPGTGIMASSARDWTDRCIDYLFIGALPTLLIFWHGLGGGRALARGGRFFLAVGVFATLYAIGRATPFFGLLFDHLPGVSLYRRPADATFLLNVSLAFLSGFLLDFYLRNGLPRPARLSPEMARRALPALAATLAVAIVVAGLYFSWLQGRLSDAARETALSALWWGLCAAGLVWFAAPRRRVAGAWLLILASGGQLVWRNAASSLNAEPQANYAIFANMSAADKAGLDILRNEIAVRRDAGARPRVEILGLDGPWQNASMVFGLENTLGYNPLRIASYERLVGPGENAGDADARRFPDTFRGYKCKLASLLGLEYLVLDRPAARLPRQFPRPSAKLIYSADHLYIYRIGRAAPRAYVAAALFPADIDQIIADDAFPEFDRTREALIDPDSLKLVSAAIARVDAATPIDRRIEQNNAPAGAATIVSYDDNRVVLRVDTRESGVLVLHDLYYPGWQARVDGVVTPVLRANALFRGVEIGPGRHLVEFDFQPFSTENLLAAVRAAVHKNKD